MWRYAVGAAMARTGDEASGPALLLAGLAATGSASTASLFLAAVTIAAAAGGPVLGVLIDRAGRPGRLLTGALAGYASAFGLIVLSLGRVPVVLTVLVAVAAGFLRPALSGGWTAQLPRAVPQDELPRASALDAMTFDLAALSGPALAGVAAGFLGASAGAVLAVVLICLALPVAWRLPAARATAPAFGAVSATSAEAAGCAGPRASIQAGVAAGFRAILRSPTLARATATSVVSCAGQGMLIACCPLMGEQSLGGAGRGALLLSVLAASALAANALLARRPGLLEPDTVLWSSTLVLAAALLLAATGHPVLLIAAMLIAGLGEGPQLTALFAVRHREAPDHLRGQIFTTGASLKISGFALGAAAAGPIADWSPAAALPAAAGVQVLAALTYCGTSRITGRLRSSPVG